MGLKIDGKDIETLYGVYVLGRGTYGAPEKDLELVHVPGRSGDVVIDHGCYRNVQVVYPDCWILDDFPGNSEGLRELLMGHTNYVKIVDPYHPDEFRRGLYVGPFEPEPVSGLDNNAGRFDLSFSCMPQRWLNSGAVTQNLFSQSSSVPASAVLTNPTQHTAIPDIEFSFKARQGDTVRLRRGYSNAIAITDFPKTTTESYTYYYDSLTGKATLSNTGVSVSPRVLTLTPGSNTITVEGCQEIEYLHITPNWFVL